MSRRKPRFALQIDALAAGGDGLGRDANGRVTFVARTAVGDRALIELEDVRKEFARGRLIELIETSGDRKASGCELFDEGQCGGCQWRHLRADVQAEAKADIVAQALRKSIAAGATLHPLQEVCELDGWRRRVRLSFWAKGDQRALGFFPSRSHRVTDVEHCRQLAPELSSALELLRELLLPQLRGRGEIELLLSEDSTVHVAVLGGADRDVLAELASRDGIAGVVHATAAGSDVSKTWGAEDVVLEGGIRASAAGFAQASREGNLALRERVASLCGELAGLRVLELYAGTGNLTSLLRGAASVVAIEQMPGGLEDVDWRVGDAAALSAKLADEGERFDLIVLDPPRAGAKDALDAMAALGPKRIVYVSCNPATLGRDAQRLAELGFVPTDIFPIDLMPQTAQVEVVMAFEAEPG